MISQWGLVEKGLTDPESGGDFRIYSIYATPWWSSEDSGKRARLVGGVLLNSSGYESRAAAEALRDINDPTTVQYLADYVAQNRDNPEGRKFAITILAGKDTDAAWAAIADAAQHDNDESVRKHAQDQLDGRNVAVAGVRITSVGAESQGALAGIKVGDILTHYNETRVKTIQDIITARDAVGEGESVKVVVRRGAQDLTLTLGPGQIGINGVAVAPKE
jgi:membrane-associated protease RseP (regulator of RpoE activity)